MTDRPRETLPRSVRIRSRRDFERVFDLKIRATDALITLYGAPSNCALARLGIAAGRRLGNAVVRNRTKRLIREAFRRVRHTLPSRTDWVVVPRTGAELAPPNLQVSIINLARRLAERVEARRRAMEAADAVRNSEGSGATKESETTCPERRGPVLDQTRKKKAPGA
ncbi:MAG TPA: ribonuclease P protein component [Phycisphaerae bacterium]|nr:ribonuclease P protein component [Phycisphaerae bacterium]HRY68378.1 ribonuclease P protein component [Phycisphaerae bacterium]HSA27795.1 ribonuclease P protein component [Phycisphaerae bacterium]